MLPYVMSVIGDERLFYASDFPHWDSHYPQSVDEMLGRTDLSDDAKRKLMRDNAIRLYGL